MNLPRILEPEVMDTLEEAMDYDAMDHAEVNRRFVEDLLAEGPLTGEILDVGTGTAQIPIVLCRQCPMVKVVAIDLAIGMLDIARRNIEIASLRDRILLDHVDAKRMRYQDGRFDGVVSNSILHHIPQPGEALRESWRVCRPGGRFFFRDLVRPGSADEIARLVETYTGQEKPAAQRMFAESLAAALTLEEAQELVEACGGQGSEVRMTSDRHWTWSATKTG